MNLLLVGIGGAAGAMLRYAISLLPYSGTFPVPTLITNVIGAIAIGFIFGTAETKAVSPNAVMFLKTGVCGGFTTFSTFSLETYKLLTHGETGLGILYAAAGLCLCIAGTAAGVWLAKAI